MRDRIARMRAALARRGLAAYLVPSSDPHLSEYLPGRWASRSWLSGFTGSAGTLVVARDFAGVWVDSRYWVQADAELAGTGIETMRIPAASSAAHVDWLAEHMNVGDVVGVDGSVIGLAAARQLRSALAEHGVELDTSIDLLDDVWSDRPALPTQEVFEHASPFAPRSRADKLADVRAAMRDAGADAHFISTLDDIAWLFNLRGSDVEYNPVFLAHALIEPKVATLFIADVKVPGAIREALERDGVRIAPYDDARATLRALEDKRVLLIDPRRITLAFREAVPASVRVLEAINPSTFAKSRKTAEEIAHVRRAMEEDGAALAEFFAWFEAALAQAQAGGDAITELTIDEKITAARARRMGFVSPSFSTIAGFNANGAMPHYRATESSHATIAGDGLLLIDSGGQYTSGTTDITRVVPVGRVSDAQKRDFTLVLKGMIALASARFPRGTRSPSLDALARAPIWAAGVDYGHGTGHGVGYFLNVHEGPQSISPHAPPDPHTAMEPGMITSDEPGIYRPGQWGVRIENLVLAVPARFENALEGRGEFGEFLEFETLTLCPIDTRCIDRSLLRDDEKAWLNAYHDEVSKRLSPHVADDAKRWLIERTASI
ncbi:MAG: aminopeptidase P family protein [Gemmatimonadota bacterium]|nr:aminopeptidase P family protein [Gemmatimonadota bacterium]